MGTEQDTPVESWLQTYNLSFFLKNTCFLAVQRKRLQQGQSTDAQRCSDSSLWGHALNEPDVGVRMNDDGHSPNPFIDPGSGRSAQP